MEYITASCIIEGGAVYQSGKTVFENRKSDLSGFLQSVYDHFDYQYPRFYKMDMLAKLGWLASEQLLNQGFDRTEYRKEDIAIILSNSNSSLDTDLKYLETVKEVPSPSVFVYTLPNIVIGEICIRNKFKGENAFFIVESFDSAFMETYIKCLLAERLSGACLCGWVELLGQQYKAGFFLVEKSPVADGRALATGQLQFCAANMDLIFEMPKL